MKKPLLTACAVAALTTILTISSANAASTDAPEATAKPFPSAEAEMEFNKRFAAKDKERYDMAQRMKKLTKVKKPVKKAPRPRVLLTPEQDEFKQALRENRRLERALRTDQFAPAAVTPTRSNEVPVVKPTTDAAGNPLL